MKYNTTNEWNHFSFQEAYIAQLQQMNGYFTATLDNVTILPENSCNRDVRNMRCNNLLFTIREGQITSFIEEGYKVYDANGNLKKQHEDKQIAESEYQKVLDTMKDGILYSIDKKDGIYQIAIDANERTYLVSVNGIADVEEWERFLTVEAC